MKHYTKQDIIELVQEEDVEFIRLQFTDILGNLKNVAITSSQLEKALQNDCMFDGSAIEGFAGEKYADMYLYPDLDSFAIFPWRPQQGKVARMVCDVYKADRTPFEGDPRYVLKKAIAEAEKMGYTFDVGPECEFFLFQSDENGLPTTVTNEQAGYFDLGPIDFGENARRDIVLTLEDMGFVVEGSHHESAPAQHEIDFKYDEVLKTADNIMTFKLAVKTIAKRHGLHATFMPKPKFGVNGSGMHVNMSLSRHGRNIFDDPQGEKGLSKEAYWFIGGLMKHMQGMTALLNPLVNSYKRLVPGFEAPVHIAWSTANRNQLIRVPAARGEQTRIELRSPDSAANPYLALAACLQAGLEGIRGHIDPPEENLGNVLREDFVPLLGSEELQGEIKKLPGTLIEAIGLLEQDTFLKWVMGDHVYENYIAMKKQEWQEYRIQVSEWELEKYLYRV